MKFTLSWLKDHLDTDASVEVIAARLTMLGLEVESVANRAAGLEAFVVGRVLDARRHPDADKLQVCQVDTGSGVVEVVCGAPNARAGLKGVFAASGSYIPGLDVTLKKARIRGVESNGMLLSEREMGLSDQHAGIVELPEGAPVGAPAARVMGLDDPVIDIAITPNRGDCLGVRGVARDLAAAGVGRLKPLDTTPVPGTFDSPIRVHLDLPDDAKDACPYFVGRLIRGVTNGPSPQWLQDRLLAIGLRPINALVDITNLMTIDLDRPLHVFDADTVKGDIHVRLGRPDEALLALDGKTYAFDGAMTAIADDEAPEAFGGVMGGERTGCTEDTVSVFLESAWFDPIRTATTGRKLGLQSDARYRFERGIDPAFLVDGAEIATRLILDLCGGEASHLVIAGAEPDWKRTLPLRPERVCTLGGVDVPEAEIERILTVLGFGIEKDGGALRVSVPSWRGDMVGEACLVEEVVRVHGFDQVPAVPLERETDLPQPALDPSQRRRGLVRRLLATRGLNEAVTYSFMRSDHAERFGGGDAALRLVNPISADLDAMRPSILPNLITAAGRNADRGYPGAALFEIGPVFAGPRPADQTTVAAGVRTDLAAERHWAGGARAVDAFDAKADALAVLEAAGAPVDKLQLAADAPAWYHPGRSGCLRLGPKALLARFGEIHPAVLAAIGVKGPVVAFEVFLDAVPLPKAKGTTRPILTLAPFQPLSRDFAFVVDAEVGAEAVVRAARAADKALSAARITDVTVFDLFAGHSLGEGRKSIALNVVLQPTDHTLTDAEIEAAAAAVVAGVAKATGGTLRG